MQFKQEIISYLLIWFPYSRKVQKGKKKKKRHGKKPQIPGFAGKGEGLGADPLRRFLSCSIARGLKEPREKKLLGGKRALLTQSRGGDLPGHRGENKLTSKKSLSPPSLLPQAPLQLLRHQEFMFQHSVIETTGHAGLKGKAGTGELK